MRSGDEKKPLFFLALGVAMIIVDSTIVNVAMPTIIKNLNISSIQAQWVQVIYTLVFASTLLIFGRLADQIGRKKIFAFGISVFGVASVGAMMANSGDTLIFSRAIQGLGAAMMLPSSLSIINASFTGEDRRKAFAIWGSVIGGAAALGPFIGGWMITSFSWRWAFGINLPFAVLVAIGVLLYVNESVTRDFGKFDFLGSLLVATGFAAIIFGLIEGRSYGWWNPLSGPKILGLSIVPVVIFLGLLIIYIFVQRERARSRSQKPTYVDFSIFGIRSFRYASIASLIVSLGEYGLLFLLPYWLQNVLGYSGLKTGSLFLVLALGSFSASAAGRHLMAKRGSVATLKTGIALEILGVCALGLVISPHTNVWLIIFTLFIYGMGIGLATTQVTSIALRDVPTHKSGQASALSSTMRQLGFALGIAILGSSFFGLLGSGVSDRLQDQGKLSMQARQVLVHEVVTSAGTIIPELRSSSSTQSEAGAAIGALTSSSKWSALIATIFLCFGWFATRLMGRRIRSELPPRQIS